MLPFLQLVPSKLLNIERLGLIKKIGDYCHLLDVLLF